MILNLLPMLYFLTIVIRKIQLLHQRDDFVGELKLNARVVDARGTIPFLGTPGYFEELDATNFPYVVRDVGFLRNLDDPTGWLDLSIDCEESGPNGGGAIDVIEGMSVFAHIAQSLGIAPSVTFGIRDGDPVATASEPLASMLIEVHSTSFSFVSQQNPKSLK